jgi:hypothetical protein
MNAQQLIAAAVDPSVILKAQGIEADSWQKDILFCTDQQILMNCCRQAGKSTVVSAKALHTALYTPGSLSLILSPGQRQSAEVFHKIVQAYNAMNRPVRAEYETQLKIELANGSRVICLPGKEETVRCFTPDLLIIDEASRVPDDLYRAVRPMLAVKKGRLIALSTPFGQRGWFFDEWEGEGPWKKVKVTWKECQRISADFIAEELRAMGQGWVDQEYNCLFTALEGLVYPDFAQCYTDFYTLPAAGKSVGGIDWGWRNPFAAVWGVLDRDDVLHIQDERYLRETPLHDHAKALPKIMWYADPAGRTEIEEFRSANHTIRRGMNDIRLGIAAIAARIRTGRLKVNWLRCRNLCAEAKLYRYPDAKERTILGENPVDEHNHALGALRYLVSRIDSRFIAKLRRKAPSAADGPIETDAIEEAGERSRPTPKPSRLDITDPNLWEVLN